MDEKKIQKIVDDIGEIGTVMEEYRGKVDKLESADRVVPGDLTEVREKIAEDIAGKFMTLQQAKEIMERQDELKELVERIANSPDKSEEDLEAFGIKAFFTEVRRYAFGPEFRPTEQERTIMSDENYKRAISGKLETRDMTEGTDTTGGFLVPDTIATKIIEKYIDVNPVRSVAGQVTITSSNEYVAFREKDHPEPENVGEVETATEDEVEFWQHRIPCHHIRARVPISEMLLDDVPALEQTIVRIVGRKFLRKESQNFISGNGIKRAFGIVHSAGTDNTQWPALVTGAGTAIIDADDFATMIGNLDQIYWPNAKWMFNQGSLAKIMNLKDSDNNYLWGLNDALITGWPERIRGFPFVLCNTIADEGDDKYPVYFGDFNEGYLIVDRRGIRMLKDPFTDYPVTHLRFSSRVGGRVVDPYAIKILKTT